MPFYTYTGDWQEGQDERTKEVYDTIIGDIAWQAAVDKVEMMQSFPFWTDVTRDTTLTDDEKLEKIRQINKEYHEAMNKEIICSAGVKQVCDGYDRKCVGKCTL
jgi:hypothetical protein